MPLDDEPSWEINPGSHLSDPDYSPESWAEMSIADYLIVIGNYGDDLDSIEEVLRNMPRAVYDEYAEMDFPDLPDELRPDYVPPEIDEEDLGEEEDED